MNFQKSHFWYNKRQRNGILFLLALILVLQLLYIFVDFSSSNNTNFDVSELDAAQTQIDSLKRMKIEKSKPKIFPFNPNYITDFKAYQLGLSLEEIDKLFDYRKTGKFVNSAKEFQNITKVNDSLLSVISPYFKFPEWVNNNQKKSAENKFDSKNTPKPKQIIKDLNLATINDLKSINGIGEKLAKRIISYRELLNGYTYNEQLYEVYYLDKAIADKVLKQFTVFSKPEIQKININKATFKEILHLPYIDYNLTKKICNYRDEIGDYATLEDLKKIDSFPLEKFDRITLYLVAD